MDSYSGTVQPPPRKPKRPGRRARAFEILVAEEAALYRTHAGPYRLKLSRTCSRALKIKDNCPMGFHGVLYKPE